MQVESNYIELQKPVKKTIEIIKAIKHNINKKNAKDSKEVI